VGGLRRSDSEIPIKSVWRCSRPDDAAVATWGRARVLNHATWSVFTRSPFWWRLRCAVLTS